MADDDESRLRPKNTGQVGCPTRAFPPGFQDHQGAVGRPEVANEQFKPGRAPSSQRFFDHLQFNRCPFGGQKPLFKIGEVVRPESV